MLGKRTVMVDIDLEGMPVFLCDVVTVKTWAGERVKRWRFFCPECLAFHIHTPSEGHRVAHCGGGRFRENGGYWITRCEKPWTRKRLPWRKVVKEVEE
jgi:hypothetical protein